MYIYYVTGTCKKPLNTKGKAINYLKKGFGICVKCTYDTIDDHLYDKLSILFKSEIKEIQINEIKNLGKSNEV